MSSTSTTGVLLAGGRSSRMGRDKALLDWQGRPLIEHMIAQLYAAGVNQVRVSGDRPDYHGIPDGLPEGGPVVGLHSVANTLPDGCLLIVPVDMPRLTPELLRQLLQAPDAGAVQFTGYTLPLRLRLDGYSRAVLADVAGQPGRDCSLHRLLSRLATRKLPLPDHAASQLGNCNTPEDWQQARQP